MIEIKVLESDNEILSAYPIMHQLRIHLEESEYVQLAKEMKEEYGYQLAALYDGGVMKAVIGFMPRLTLSNGHFIYVSDLVTDCKSRSKGYGKELLQYVHEYSKEKGYSLVSLTSGLQRVDAHRFYKDKMKYEQTSYTFRNYV